MYLMAVLARHFIALTVFSLPLFIYYSSNDVREFALNPMYPLKQFSLGNLGGSNVICMHQRMAFDNVFLSCPHGMVIDYDNILYGVLSPELDKANYCYEPAIWENPSNSENA